MKNKLYSLLGSASVVCALTSLTAPAHAFIVETRLPVTPSGGVTWQGFTHNYSAAGDTFTGNATSSDFASTVFTGEGTSSITAVASGGTGGATPRVISDINVSGANPTILAKFVTYYSVGGGATTSAPPLSFFVTPSNPLGGKYFATKLDTVSNGSIILEGAGDGLTLQVNETPSNANAIFSVKGELLNALVSDPDSILFTGSAYSYRVGTGAVTGSPSPTGDGTLVFSQVPEPNSILGSIFALGGLVALKKSAKDLKKSK